MADVFDALTSHRPYKRAIPANESFVILQAERGKHFDPRVIDAFFETVDEILKIHADLRDTE